MSTTFPNPLPEPGRLAPLPPRPDGVTHWYARPSWTCDHDCGPWPCPVARVELGDHFADDPTALALFVVAHLPHAAAEAGTLLVDELHELFVAWTRPAVRPAAAPEHPDRDPRSARVNHGAGTDSPQQHGTEEVPMDLYALDVAPTAKPGVKLCGGNLTSDNESCAVVREIQPGVYEVTDSKAPERPGLRFDRAEMENLGMKFPAEFPA
ncbi:hypothetical protein [Micromonospora sp. WMMC273]|uniref:hypothetical protein n=1 Tax=Micromonospora sp. WMMC273 TaxID=3015157 RepID=UPI0022B65C71|nr:hypothetical protein [Micromonospora sp. WMMC273]MCZ7478861.1 hypothetical protein [Micromonospora sp. WMMC273]MCZ7478970.1 hypothetical protein [Micromonospora sp. WMMC273]